MYALRKGSALRVRYLVKFTKDSDIKFISHLDIMRTIQRVVKRSKLNVEYSKGFNPHMSISIAQPLSVGMYSSGEYMDLVLNEETEIEVESIMRELNENSPGGIEFLDAVRVKERVGPNEKKVPQSMALIDGALYNIKIKYTDDHELSNDMKKIMETSEWLVLKVGKVGKSVDKIIDIRPMVKDFQYTVENDVLNIQALVSCGSRENLSAELLSRFIKNNTKYPNLEAFTDIKREEMYAYKNKKLLPLNTFIR